MLIENYTMELQSKGSYIGNFRSYDKMHIISQNELMEKIVQTYAEMDSNKNRQECVDMYRNQFERLGAYKHIKQRQSIMSLEELIEYCKEKGNAYEKRLHQSLVKVTGELLKKSFEKPGELDTVILIATTGAPFSPSPLQEVLSKNNSDAKHLHLYHMDCYAALPALATANAFARTLRNYGAEKNRNVTVLHEELSSAYFGTNRNRSTGNFICDSLFADGCIAYDAMPYKPNGDCLELLSVQYCQWENSMDYITICHSSGNVELNKELSELIGKCCLKFFEPISHSLGDIELDSQRIHVAIHAGGPRLLDVVQSTYNLREEQMRFAWSILKEKGNLESATVVYQLKDILLDTEVKDGDKVLMLAFGPGITSGFATFIVHKN